MKTVQITVRNVDPALKRRIDKLAKLRAVSINDLALEALRTEVGLGHSKELIDWGRYAGTMSKKAINDQVLDDFERVDPAMWSADHL